MPELSDVTVTYTAKEAAELHLGVGLLLDTDEQRPWLGDHKAYLQRCQLVLEKALKRAGFHLTDDGWAA